ncbi:MAG: ABC-2 type transport system ATP-binding protein [Salinirussus sp.]|jgi:ABC-2 type transport system ATP-binding protein
MAAIRVEGLGRVFGDTVAVDEVSFAVGDGELFGLLGPNGAGKSTLVGMCCTLLRPTAGSAVVSGHDIRTERAAVRGSIGVVFQETALDEELTGVENLVFHARLYGLSRARRRERVPEVLDMVDLTDVADDTVDTYSGGMQRRLEIARGFLHEPAVLFLDEPTLGLDAGTRRDTWEYIRALNDRGVTVVMTTHYMEEADTLCDRVAVMDDGEVVALDSPAQLKAGLGGDVVTVETADRVTGLPDRLRGVGWVRGVEVTGNGLSVTVDDGARRVADVVRLADEAGVTVSAVDRRAPSLETVFLDLTGREVRAGESSGLAEPAGDKEVGATRAGGLDGGA